MTDLIDQTIGSYRIEESMGTGGLSQVFRARHIHRDIVVALKVMHESLSRSPGFEDLFRREAKVIAALRHPHIVEVLDFGVDDGRCYFVLEFMGAGSMHSLLRHRTQPGQGLPLVLGLDLVRQAADGIAYAHSQGWVHHSITLGNLLLAHNPTVALVPYALKIDDFGIVRLIQEDKPISGIEMGNAVYISPEECQGTGSDGRSNVYALGVVLYEVVTGRLPFVFKTFIEAIHNHVNVPPPSPRSLRPDLPPEVETIILRCLAKRPDERFQSATDLSYALREAVAQLPPELQKSSALASTTILSPGVSVAPLATATSAPLALAVIATTVPRVRVLDGTGKTLQIVDLQSSSLTVGRASVNNLVLDAPTVSRHHMRLDWDGNQVSVVDLGSSNGTLLAGIRLLPQSPQVWDSRELLRVGPFWLQFEPPTAIHQVPPPEPPPNSAPPNAPDGAHTRPSNGAFTSEHAHTVPPQNAQNQSYQFQQPPFADQTLPRGDGTANYTVVEPPQRSAVVLRRYEHATPGPTPASPPHDAPVAPAEPRLNIRFAGLEPDQVLPVDQRVALIIWIDTEQSAARSREDDDTTPEFGNKLATHALAFTLPSIALFDVIVRVDADPDAWAIEDVQSKMVVVPPDSTKQQAVFMITARAAGHDKLRISLERAGVGTQLQQVWLPVESAAIDPTSLEGKEVAVNQPRVMRWIQNIRSRMS
jgi:serine/threonine protein kinase